MFGAEVGVVGFELTVSCAQLFVAVVEPDVTVLSCLVLHAKFVEFATQLGVFFRRLLPQLGELFSESVAFGKRGGEEVAVVDFAGECVGFGLTLLAGSPCALAITTACPFAWPTTLAGNRHEQTVTVRDDSRITSVQGCDPRTDACQQENGSPERAGPGADCDVSRRFVQHWVHVCRDLGCQRSGRVQVLSVGKMWESVLGEIWEGVPIGGRPGWWSVRSWWLMRVTVRVCVVGNLAGGGGGSPGRVRRRLIGSAQQPVEGDVVGAEFVDHECDRVVVEVTDASQKRVEIGVGFGLCVEQPVLDNADQSSEFFDT